MYLGSLHLERLWNMNEIRALTENKQHQTPRADILCSEKLLCWNTACRAVLVCAQWSSLQCWNAVKKAETYLTLAFCLSLLNCQWKCCTQRAACGSTCLRYDITENVLTDSKGACRKHSAASTGGQSSGQYRAWVGGGCAQPTGRWAAGTGTAYLQYARCLGCAESGTQTLLHLTQSTAHEMSLQALFPWKWTLASASPVKWIY